jgi:branched-chain amino acid transport system substrate-binding protein
MKSLRYFFIITVFAFCSCSVRTGIIIEKDKPGDVLFRQAENKFLSGEYDNALEDYAKYLDEFPDQSFAPAALLKTGAIYSARGEYERARRTYQIMLKQYPKSPYVSDGMVEILVTYYNEGNYNDVIRLSYEVPENLVPGDYLVRKYAIIGDAFLALGFTGDEVIYFITA